MGEELIFFWINLIKPISLVHPWALEIMLKYIALWKTSGNYFVYSENTPGQQSKNNIFCRTVFTCLKEHYLPQRGHCLILHSELKMFRKWRLAWRKDQCVTSLLFLYLLAPIYNPNLCENELHFVNRRKEKVPWSFLCHLILKCSGARLSLK